MTLTYSPISGVPSGSKILSVWTASADLVIASLTFPNLSKISVGVEDEVADVTLADEGDRDILLQGMIMVLKYVGGEEDERSGTTTNCERAQVLT